MKMQYLGVVPWSRIIYEWIWDQICPGELLPPITFWTSRGTLCSSCPQCVHVQPSIHPMDHSMSTAAAAAGAATTSSSGPADPLLLEMLSTAAAAGAEACESSPWPVDDELGSFFFSAANCAACCSAALSFCAFILPSSISFSCASVTCGSAGGAVSVAAMAAVVAVVFKAAGCGVAAAAAAVAGPLRLLSA